jgi:dihydroflavonol-4-reductase
MKDVGSVVHVAGFVSNARRDRERLFGVNAVGGWNLLEAAGGAGVGRVVFTSSTSAVGALREDRPEDALGEDAPFELHDLVVPYVHAKRAAHEAALEARNDGLPVVVLSPTFVLGPGDRRLTSSELVDAFVRKQLPGYLAGGINPVDVRDVAQACVAALEHPDPAPHYILAGPENLTQNALFQRLERLSGIRAPRLRIPHWAALAAGLVGERVVPGAALTSATVRLGALYWYFDATLARRDLGFDPRPLDQTLRSSLDWVTHLSQSRLGEAS